MRVLNKIRFFLDLWISEHYCVRRSPLLLVQVMNMYGDLVMDSVPDKVKPSMFFQSTSEGGKQNFQDLTNHLAV